MKNNTGKLRSCILQVIRYYAQFNYAPTAQEIYAYLRLATSTKQLEKELKKMIEDRVLVKKELKMPESAVFEAGRVQKKIDRYTLGEYSSKVKTQSSKLKSSLDKISQIELYIGLLSIFPQIRLIGLSGSVAMLSAQESEDIDLFIISSKNRLWTARFIAVIVAKLLGRHRSRWQKNVKDKICLNLFFDEGGMRILPAKRSFYVAHEVLQMKPLFVRQNVYNRFLQANSWVFKIYPNAKSMLRRIPPSFSFPPVLSQNTIAHVSGALPFGHPSPLGNMIEGFLKKLQLDRIEKTRTTEIITDKQLWFFPNDFEKKIRSERS